MYNSYPSRGKSWVVPWSFAVLILVVFQALLAWIVHRSDAVLACNSFVLLTVLGIALWISIGNALKSDWRRGLFWTLVAGGSALWALNPLLALLYVAGLKSGLSGRMLAGSALFFHTTMLLAAVACRPDIGQPEQRSPRAVLNSLLCISGGMFVYASFLIPETFPHWDQTTVQWFAITYSAANIILVVMTAWLALGMQVQWKLIYSLLFGTSAIYSISAAITDLRIVSNGHYPNVFDGLNTAAACMLIRAAIVGRRLRPEPARSAPMELGSSSMDISAVLIVTAVPLFSLLKLLHTNGHGNISAGRLAAALSAVLLLSAIAFIKEYFIHRRFVRDMNRVHDQLDLAMRSGKSIAWDLNVASGEGIWFGDLRTFFGIPATTCFLPVRQLRSLIYPEDYSGVSKAISDSLCTAKPFAAVFRIFLPDRSLMWVKSHGRFYYRANGAPTRMLGIAVDINEQKQAESALWETELRFRNVADKAPVLLWMSARDQLCDYFNRAWLDFTGRPIEAELGKGWMAGIHPGDRDRYIKTYNEAFDGQKPFTIEYRLRRDGAEYRWILANAVPRFTLTSKFEGYIGSAIDVTEVKRAQEVLQKSEEEFSLAFESAHLGWWVWTEETQQLNASEGSKAVFGLPPDTEVTLKAFLNCIHHEDCERVYKTWRQAIETGSYLFVEFRIVWADGAIHWVESRGRIYPNSQSRPAQMVGVTMDITERKRAEEALRAVGGRLIAAQEEERGRIARELHDDVCQRLAVIGMELERIKDEPQLSEPRLQEWIGRLAQHTGQVADDLQALSHELHSSKLEILGTTAAMKSFCAQFSEQHHIRVEFTSNKVPFPLPRDVSLCLYRILQEALHNAAKHSKAERLLVELRGECGTVELIVRDSGVGFDPEKVAQGHGLGLISMRERVNLVKGTLSIESQPRLGTAIRARVPVEEMNSAQCA